MPLKLFEIRGRMVQIWSIQLLLMYGGSKRGMFPLNAVSSGDDLRSASFCGEAGKLQVEQLHGVNGTL